MTQESRQSLKEQAEKARTLFERVNNYSFEAANGSHESVSRLLDTLVSRGPDDGPDIPIAFETLQFLSSRERFAIDIAHNFCSDFNREFSWHSSAGSLLDWDNEHLKQFFLNLGKTVQGILHPDGQFGQDVVGSMIQTNEAYYNLVNWAEEQLTKGRT